MKLAILLLIGQVHIATDSPNEAFVGEVVEIQIDGLPKFDPQKSYAENVAWKSKLQIAFDSPRNCVCKMQTLLAVDFLTDKPIVTVRISASEPGDVVLICAWSGDQKALTAHRVAVKTRGPPPKPDPPKPDPDDEDEPEPDPDVVPPGRKHVIIVEESSQRTPKLASLFATLRGSSIASDHVLHIVDKDTTRVDLASYAVLARSVPFIFVASDSGQILNRGPLPESVDEIKKLLGE